MSSVLLDDESPFVDYLGLSLDADLEIDYFKYLVPLEKKIKLSIEVGYRSKRALN